MPNIYGEKSNTRVQWEKIKDGSLQEKFDWFIQYFGLYTLLAVALIAGIVAWIVTATRPKTPEVLSGILLDAEFEEEQSLAVKEALCADLGYDPNAYSLGLYASPFGAEGTESQLYQQEGILARVAAKELDLLGARGGLKGYVDPEDRGASILFPLFDVLPEDLFLRLEASGRVLYVDTEDEGRLPYFIDITGSAFSKLAGITAEHYEIAFLCTAPHPEGIEALVRLILSE